MLAEFWSHWAAPFLWLLGVTAIGFVVDSIIYSMLQRRAERRHERVLKEVASAIHGFPTVVAFLIGFRVATLHADLSLERLTLINQIHLTVTIIAVTAFAARIAGRTIKAYTSREDAALPSSSIFVNLTRGLIWVLGGLTLLAAFGISIAPLLTAMGIGGIVLGLALQDTLANLVAGVQVLLSGQIEPDDFIRLESGDAGWVIDVTWRNTTVRRLSNDLVIVPNAKLGSELVTNYTKMDEKHVLWVSTGVAYGSDLEQVERITLDVARQIAHAEEGADPEYESLLRFKNFGDSSIDLIVSIRCDNYLTHYRVESEMIKHLHARFAQEGIEIPFPQRVVTMAGDTES